MEMDIPPLYQSRVKRGYFYEKKPSFSGKELPFFLLAREGYVNISRYMLKKWEYFRIAGGKQDEEQKLVKHFHPL
jgi:hypothetical protein